MSSDHAALLWRTNEANNKNLIVSDSKYIKRTT